MLTDAGIKKLGAKGKDYRVFDRASDPGFGVRVSAKGRKSFFYVFRFDGKYQYVNLGRPDDVGLVNARNECRNYRELVRQGMNPKDWLQQRIQQEQEAKAAKKAAERLGERMGSVERLFQLYIDRLDSKGKRSVNQVRRIWKADIEPIIGRTKAKDVTPNDVKRILHTIIQRGSMIMANRCRSYLLSAFRFGIEWDNDPANYDTSTRFQIVTNPVRDVPKPQKEEDPGERTLNSLEVQECWRLWGNPGLISLQCGTVLRMILTTGGQRVEAVLRAGWCEFDTKSGIWEIPAHRTKTKKRPHVIPLTPLTLRTLNDLREITGDSELLFPMRGNNMLPTETNSLGNAVRKFCQRVEVDRFTARDLRRTVKTLMGKMGLSKEIRDRLQDHALSDVSSKHYDRYDYLKEKKVAMDAWELYLREIIEDQAPSSNVVKIERTN